MGRGKLEQHHRGVSEPWISNHVLQGPLSRKVRDVLARDFRGSQTFWVHQCLEGHTIAAPFDRVSWILCGNPCLGPTTVTFDLDYLMSYTRLTLATNVATRNWHRRPFSAVVVALLDAM